MQEKQATIYDVAEKAGVSIATVSRAMSGGSISAKSRRKVEKAMEELDYLPLSSRVAATKNERRSLGLVVGDMNNPYCSALVRGAEEEAARYGYALELYIHPTDSVSNEMMIRRILEHRPAGIALTGGLVEDGPPERILRNLDRLQKEMQVVTIGPPLEGTPCINIYSDARECIRKSTTHLINLGHRNIAFIGGSPEVRLSDSRRQAYFLAMENAGVSPKECRFYGTGFTAQTGETGVSQMIASLKGRELPTAIVAINDMTALGAMRQLQRMGLRVPEDVAVIGCDNVFFSSYLNPPLTTVDLHADVRGRTVMASLVHALRGDTLPYDRLLESSLVVRESCGATGARNLRIQNRLNK